MAKSTKTPKKAAVIEVYVYGVDGKNVPTKLLKHLPATKVFNNIVYVPDGVIVDVAKVLNGKFKSYLTPKGTIYADLN